MLTNFAQRAHNHNFETDWILRSLLDTDFYKLAMAQFIWKHFRDVHVSFRLINRSVKVRLGETIDADALRNQLDHARDLSFRKSELIWLAGNTFYGTTSIFEPDFIRWLADFRLPPYTLEKSRADGQWCLDFEGAWPEATMWELYAIPIVNELRNRAGLAKLSESELDILYARAKVRLWDKIDRLRGIPGLKFADFGTRRRHSFLWQEHVITTMAAELPEMFTGTSDTFLAYKHGLEAIGTNAHELPMTLAALARHGKLGDVSLKESQYEVLRLWQETYGQAMRIMLPDTFGTTQFLQGAPDWVADWTGIRIDSKNPAQAGEEAIAFFEAHGKDPRSKLIIPSDGLDVDDIIRLHAQFGGRVMPGYSAETDFHDASDFLDERKWVHEPRIRVSAGWGTFLTNDFRQCHPRGSRDLDPISLVCKVAEVEGYPAVKLSDNYTKATGPVPEIDFYRETFGAAGIENAPVFV